MCYCNGRRYSAIISAALLLGILTACGDSVPEETLNREQAQTQDISVTRQRQYLSFEDALVGCTDIIEATYVKTHSHDFYDELEFRVNRVLKGATETETIFVFSELSNVEVTGTDISYVSGTYTYNKDEEYLLILEREVSVYYEHDRYRMFCDIYIPFDDAADSRMYDEDLSAYVSPQNMTSIQTLSAYIESCIEADGGQAPEFYGTAYVESDNIEDIANASDYIFAIKVGELLTEGAYNDTETYNCAIEDVLSGSLSEEEISAGILVVFFNDAGVQPGDEYIVMVNRPGETSRIYALSSRNSILSLSSKAEIQDIIA